MGAKLTIEINTEDENEIERAHHCAQSWARLLRKYWGLRRLQFIFSTTGQALQQYEANARIRVADVYNKK